MASLPSSLLQMLYAVNDTRHYFVHSSVHSKPSSILGLQPRDKTAMLAVNTKETFLLNLHQNRVHFPAERTAFFLTPNMAALTSLANQQ